MGISNKTRLKVGCNRKGGYSATYGPYMLTILPDAQLDTSGNFFESLSLIHPGVTEEFWGHKLILDYGTS